MCSLCAEFDHLDADDARAERDKTCSHCGKPFDGGLHYGFSGYPNECQIHPRMCPCWDCRAGEYDPNDEIYPSRA